jgi:hypothetical protein
MGNGTDERRADPGAISVDDGAARAGAISVDDGTGRAGAISVDDGTGRAGAISVDGGVPPGGGAPPSGGSAPPGGRAGPAASCFAGPPLNLRLEHAERIDAGSLGTAEVLGIASPSATAVELDPVIGERLTLFLHRLRGFEQRDSALQRAAVALRGYGRWLAALKGAAVAERPGAAIAAMLAGERLTLFRAELGRDLVTYTRSGALDGVDYERMRENTRRRGFDASLVDELLAAQGIPRPARAAPPMSARHRPPPMLGQEGDGEWDLARLQDAMLEKFGAAVKVANLSFDHKHSLYAYLEAELPAAKGAAGGALKAAEEASCPALAVWHFLWATGRPELHVGGPQHAPVAEPARRVRDLAELERLVAGTFVLDELGAALEDGLLEAWLALVAKERGPAQAAAAEARRRARGLASTLKRDYLRVQVMRVLWAAGLRGLPLWDASHRPAYVADMAGLVGVLGRCHASMQWALVNGALGEWLSFVDARAATLAAEALRAHKSDGLALWAFLWSTGQVRSLYLPDGETTTTVDTVEELEALHRTKPNAVLAAVAAHAVPLWLELVHHDAGIAKFLREQDDLRASPVLALTVVFWHFFRGYPLVLGGRIITVVRQLVELFDEAPDVVVPGWRTGVVRWWLRMRDGGNAALFQWLAAAEATLVRNPTASCSAVMWRLGARSLPTGRGPLRELADVLALDEKEIEALMRDDQLPAWLELARQDATAAATARRVFREKRGPLGPRAVRWALGPRKLALGPNGVSSVAELLAVADAVRPELESLALDGTLGAWLSPFGVDRALLARLGRPAGSTELDGADDPLEDVLRALGAAPAVARVTPTTIGLKKLRGDVIQRSFGITVENVGSRGILYGRASCPSPFVKLSDPSFARVGPGKHATISGKLHIPIRSLPRRQIIITIETNVGNFDVGVDAAATRGSTPARVLLGALSLAALAATFWFLRR